MAIEFELPSVVELFFVCEFELPLVDELLLPVESEFPVVFDTLWLFDVDVWSEVDLPLLEPSDQLADAFDELPDFSVDSPVLLFVPDEVPFVWLSDLPVPFCSDFDWLFP